MSESEHESVEWWQRLGGSRYSKSTSGRGREQNVGENIAIKRKARANEQTAEQTSGRWPCVCAGRVDVGAHGQMNE